MTYRVGTPAKHGDVYIKGPVELRCGPYQDVLGDVEADAVICDPPYSERTHTGQRSLRADERESNRSKGAVPAIHYAAGCELPEWPSARWLVAFCDHAGWNQHEATLVARGMYVFQPVVWLKPDATPRFSGDGPCSAIEYLIVARPRARVRRHASRPGYYVHASAGADGISFVGRKPLPLMRTVIRDYSEPGDLVADPFAGTATTLIAAALEGRRAIGAELDPETFAKAAARIERTALTAPLPLCEPVRMTQEPLL